MDGFSIATASGMRSRLESLDLLANNLANARTAGYKMDREFYNIYQSEEAAIAAAEIEDPRALALPVIQSHFTDFTQGPLESTGNPYHVALSGPGFFAVESPGGTLYTRNGGFRVSEEGRLVTTEGYQVRMQGSAPVTIPPGADIQINAQGEIVQEGLVLGQLEIADFPNRNTIGKAGDTYYRIVEEGAVPAQARNYQVVQGSLESSNVSAPESSVRLIHIMRQFETLQKALTQNREATRRAVEELASPS